MIVENTSIVADFDAFKDSTVWDRFMLNCSQFAAAKTVAENKMLKEALYDDKGVRKGYSEFKRDAKSITDISNDTWLRTEYDMGIRSAVSGEQFKSYKNDKDLFPYWRYLHTISANPNIDHLQLVGNIYRIGDPESDAIFPPGNWNCQCGSEQLDDYDISDNGLNIRNSDEIQADLKEINPQFRYDPSISGILPKSGHSYFKALPNANAANASTFGE